MFNKMYSAYYKDTCRPFNVLANEIEAIADPEEMTEPNSALILWGGTDIQPSLYNHPESKLTFAGAHIRDEIEVALLKEAVKRSLTIIGVCRGAQLLCAAAGGFLIQDVTNHAGDEHYVTTVDGAKLFVNSLHHQMMAGLEKTEHELIAWSSINRSDGYIYKNDLKFSPPPNWVEPEYVYFPKLKAHAIQWHPEYMETKVPATEYILNKIKEKYGNSSGGQ